MSGPLARLIALADELDCQLSASTCDSGILGTGKKLVFLSLGDGRSRAVTSDAIAETVQDSCKRLIANKKYSNRRRTSLWRWARIDVATNIREVSWGDLKRLFNKTKRNYFKYGIAFGDKLSTPITEAELLGWSLLYSPEHKQSFPRENHLKKFSQDRFGVSFGWPDDDDTRMFLFSTISGFCDSSSAYLLEANGPYRGYRKINDWNDCDVLSDLIKRSTHYLSRQIGADGEYCYGRWPCFDKRIPTYNTLRHFSSTYSLLEGWEFTRQEIHLAQAKRALDRGLQLYSETLNPLSSDSKSDVRFLREINGEIKLGGTAHVVLALCKYQELTGDISYRDTIASFARGLAYMQDLAQQGFIHVLNYKTFAIHSEFRTIYYDGEALFALVKAYEATGDSDFIERALRAARDFIADDHWKAHDHWLAYGFAALFRYSPRQEFLKFGLDNIRGHLSFIKTRITTYPTLLELCMATHRLIQQASASDECHDLLDEFDMPLFIEAMHHRARYLVNGFFWPETAMFFRKPDSVLNSFFIRHHAFRTRIDDNEHYISGFCAYYKMLSVSRSAS